MSADPKLVEIVARAMVTEFGEDPDEKVKWTSPGYEWPDIVARWEIMAPQARKQIVAFEAIRQAYRMTGKQF